MHSEVGGSTVLSLKHFVTLIAFEWALILVNFVHSEMDSPTSLGCEGSVTLRTLKWLLMT